MTEAPEAPAVQVGAPPTIEQKLARAAEQAAEMARFENRTMEQVKNGLDANDRPINAGVSAADALELPTIVFTDDQVYNRPQKFELRPERGGIEELNIYLRAVPANEIPDLMNAIGTSWPLVLHVASYQPLLPGGTFDIDAMARQFTDMRRNEIEQGLVELDREYTPEELKIMASRHTTTRLDILRMLGALQQWGTEWGIDRYIPGMASCVWALAKDCHKENQNWTEETLQEALRNGFTLVDFARLARTLLEVNSVGGGYVNDLVDLFTEP